MKILHQLKGKKIGEINVEYTVYNGVTGKFFYLQKPPNPNCQLCGKEAPPIITVSVPRTMVIENLELLLRKEGYQRNPELEASYYRMDSDEMEPLVLDRTFQEENVRNGETMYAMGFLQKGKDTDIYVKIRFTEGMA